MRQSLATLQHDNYNAVRKTSSREEVPRLIDQVRGGSSDSIEEND